MRTTDKLYNAKVKRAGSGHELGEVGEVAAGCGWLRLACFVQWSPSKVAAYSASRRRVVPSYSQALSQVGSPKLEGHSIPGYHALRSARRGNHVSRSQRYTSMRFLAIQSETVQASCEEAPDKL